ncbi:MAG: sodium-dependent transporter [Clostridia bacterium]|nr:sodium-dependent transporter [Clostridia bacterium]
MSEKRGSFTGKLGFVLAAAGSAVGLGNIWRFPYLAAQYGGGIFLLVYLILAVTLGFTLMTAEIAIGRKTGLSAIGAFKKLDKRFGFIGWLGSLVPMIILPYYSVIGGWVTKYLFTFLKGDMPAAATDGFFGAFIADPVQPIGWFALFIGVTAVVVLFGVEKGVEKVSKLMMPILVVLTVAVAVYSLTVDGAMEGLKYYLIPNFDNFSVTTILAAMGQLFYSMSLSMGIMITYGSYMKKDVNLASSVSQIELFDTGIAFFAGLMVIPAVFSFSGPESLGKGPGLMFETLPKVFNSMGFAGHFVGGAFFLLVLFAALTSSISLMETVVSILRDKLGWSRRFTCLIVLIGCLVLGVPSSLGNGIWSGFTIIGMDFLTFCDFITNSVLMPITALLTCLFVGFVLKPKTLVDEVEITGPFKRRQMFITMIKWIAPICIVLILGFSVLEALGVITV